MSPGYALDAQIVVRLTTDEKERIQDVVNELTDRYENLSHFVRCSAIRLLKIEESNINIIRRHRREAEGKT